MKYYFPEYLRGSRCSYLGTTLGTNVCIIKFVISTIPEGKKVNKIIQHGVCGKDGKAVQVMPLRTLLQCWPFTATRGTMSMLSHAPLAADHIAATTPSSISDVTFPSF